MKRAAGSSAAMVSIAWTCRGVFSTSTVLPSRFASAASSTNGAKLRAVTPRRKTLLSPG
jgi:hypothetical protein